MKKSMLSAMLCSALLSTQVSAMAQPHAPAPIDNHKGEHQTITHDSSSMVVSVMDLDSNKAVGTITFSDTEYGLEVQPKLKGLAEGMHGFHIHENPDCGNANKNGEIVTGGAAGGHYDPQKTEQHGMPWSNDSHLGDLPALFVDSDGEANNPVLAPRLTREKILGRAVMIHAQGDNFSDTPKPLGGGGARVACGVIGANQ